MAYRAHLEADRAGSTGALMGKGCFIGATGEGLALQGDPSYIGVYMGCAGKY